MAKKIEAGRVAMGTAKVVGYAGAAAMASSDKTQQILSINNRYADAYGDGTGVKGTLMRMAPGALLSGIAMFATSSNPEEAMMVGALTLGGAAIGALSGPVERQVGDRMLDAFSGDSIFGGEKAPSRRRQGGRGQSLRQKVAAMNRMMLPSAVGGVSGVDDVVGGDYAMGGVSNVSGYSGI